MNLGQRNTISPSGNMSSMTDLVFLLLIFFIILSTMVVNSQEVDLPESKGTTPNDGKTVTVTITKEGQYLVENTEVEKSELEMAMRAALQARSKEAIILVTDRDVPTGTTVEVLGIATVNGWKVNIASIKKRD